VVTTARSYTLQSKPLLYDLDIAEPLCEGEVDGLTVAETLTPTRLPGYERLREHTVKISCVVPDDQSLLAVHNAGYRLAEQLDLVWTYVVGRSLTAALPHLTIVEAPQGWSSNYRELQEALQDGPLRLSFSTSTTHWLHLREPPLRRALIAVRAYRTAGSVLATLIELHHAAQRARSPADLVLLSKALELARAMAPTEQQNFGRHLDHEVQNALRRRPQWLFDISNNRLETRHVARTGSDGAVLRQPISDRELADFEHDAHLVLRATVAMELGIPPVALERPV